MGKIESLDQLRAEIAFLKIKKMDEEIYINQSFAKVNKAFTGPINFLKGGLELLGIKNNKETSNSNNNHPDHPSDWVTNLGRIVLPVLLNKTILRGRGAFLKTIITLLSQTTISSNNLNKDILSTWIDKATYWIRVSMNSAKKKKDHIENDYGIPPDSETSSGKPVH